MNVKRFTLFLLLFAGFALGVSLKNDAPEVQAAFGVSPPLIKNDHILPGTSFEQIINLSRSEAVENMKITAEVRGEDKEIQKWIRIENKEGLMMKKGEQMVPMKVVVDIPKNAALKRYRGNGLFVALESSQARQGGQVGIRLGAFIMIDITVIGNKVSDYRVQTVSLQNIQQGEPFAVEIELENVGNTEVSELKGQLDIYSENETEVIKSLLFGALDEPVLPDQTVKKRIEFKEVRLDPGRYWVVIKMFKGGKVIHESRLGQKITEKVVPVVLPEETVVKKPVMPKLPEPAIEETIEKREEEKPAEEAAPPAPAPVVVREAAPAPASVVAQAPVVVREAAPAPAPESKIYLLFGLMGFGFGLLAFLGVVAVLLMVLKNQRQAALQRYLSQYDKEHKT